MAEVTIEELMRRIEEQNKKIEEQNRKIEEQNKKIEELIVQGKEQDSYIAAIVAAEDWSQTMEVVENASKDIISCDTATLYCFDNSANKFFTISDEGKVWCNEAEISDVYAAASQNEIMVNGKTAYMPITSNNNTAGILAVEKSGGFGDHDLSKTSERLLNITHIAVENEINRQKACVDQLTQLKNRHSVVEYVNSTLKGNINNSRSVCIAMCDVDHFKAVNDTYGHKAGDEVLTKIAQILQDNTRANADCAFRWGGEEMLVVLNCDPKDAYSAFERMRATVENTPIPVVADGKETEIHVTMSMGVVQIQASEEMTQFNSKDIFEQEVAKADALLYCAKETGRNKVVTTPEIYQEYVSAKAVEILPVSEENKSAVENVIQGYIADGDNAAVINALEDAQKEISAISDSDIEQISEAINAPGTTFTEKSDNSFGTIPYKDITDKKYINNVSEQHIGHLAAKLEQANIPYSAYLKNGKYTVTVDGWDNLKAARNMYNEIKMQYPVMDARKKAEIIGNADYKDIQNKVYINGDKDTISDIAQKADADGIQYSGRINGDKSAITVDGKNPDVQKFLQQCQSIEKWASKTQIKVSEIGTQEKASIDRNNGQVH